MIRSESDFVPLSKFHLFNHFSQTSWYLQKNRIAVRSRSDIKIQDGDGTLMRFNLPGDMPAPVKRNRTRTHPSYNEEESNSDEESVRASKSHDGRKRRRPSVSRSSSTVAAESEAMAWQRSRQPTRDQIWDELSRSWLPRGTGHRPPAGRRRLGMVWDARNGYWVPDPTESNTRVPSSQTSSSSRRSSSNRRATSPRENDSAESENASLLASKDAEIAKLMEELESERASRAKLSRRCEGLLDNMDQLRHKALTIDSEASQIKTQTRHEIESLRHQVALQQAEIAGLQEELNQKTRQLLAYDEESDDD